MTPQDAYVRLVEDCRLGLVRRMVVRRDRTDYVQFKPDIELADLPVFDMGEMSGAIKGLQVGGEALRASEAGQFHLPYPRCGFLYRAHATSENQATFSENQATFGHHRNVGGRWFFMVCDETLEGVLIHGFTRHDDHPRWSQLTWQCLIDPGAVTFSYDPEAVSEADPEFLDLVHESTNNRIVTVMGDIHRIVRSGSGRMTSVHGSTVTELANKRRKRDGLPPVPAIRRIDLNSLPLQSATVPSATVTGSQKAPHFRRGTWRTLPTGREVWVRPAAIHGGTPNAPPWYEIERAESIIQPQPEA